MVMALLLSAGCRTTYYKTMERFGVYKRDLLKKNVEEARDEQKKATDQFKSALARLREMYQINGGDLEKMYDRLQADFDRSQSRASAVKERIRKVETVSADLFKEWEKEIDSMQNARLASNSREKLRTTREKYQALHAAMKRAEASMEPVLAQFKDQVLYLKHNLNAQAIGALRGETLDIEKEIQRLIQDMNRSIEQADAFVQGLD
jgi:molecular chaperone GrpE (heat shock protein)